MATNPVVAPVAFVAQGPGRFEMKPNVARYIGTVVLGSVITAITFGICYPFALVLIERWKAKASTIDGRQLEFTGSATGLLGRWIGWLLLTVITLGIYSFWWIPKMHQWRWENLRFTS